MDQLSQFVDTFDRLDIVLAVFGAVIVALWRGGGKSVGGILSGALVGGLVKPLILTLVVGGIFIAATPVPELKQTPEQQDKTLKFWSK
ncbi:MAG: hypothetical protein HY245_14710 [Rhizobiales bacterium]|nr:hypothetical protein [Hyphomicrobiales bacterium]MBI3674641.1 hypothetical protein [Hyphomicrobiales bacterium]